MSNNRPQDVADILEGMTTPTPNEVYEATREYDTNYIAAAAASKAHAGGGGGSLPYVSGAGSPLDSVTPTADKPLYIDTTNGTLYLAFGATSADWIAVGPVTTIAAAGFVFQNANDVYVLGGQPGTVGGRAYFSDAWSQVNGSGQGLEWTQGGEEGLERLRCYTGTSGQHIGTLQDGDGNMIVPASVSALGYTIGGVYPRQQLTGNATSIADEASAPLTWNTSLGPNTLLNISTPTAPTVVTAGVYAVSVCVAPVGSLTTGGSYLGILALDSAGANVEMQQRSAPDTAGGISIRVSLSAMFYLPAGAAVTVTVGNDDGASSRNFLIQAAAIQRIS